MNSQVISCLSYPGGGGHWDYNHISYHVRFLPEFWGCKLGLSLATFSANRKFNQMFFKPTYPSNWTLPDSTKLQSCDV